MKRRGVFPDASFAKELVKLPVEAFVEFLDEILDDNVKAQLQKTVVKDKLLPDRSFKALATGVLMKLGEKVAGKAGEQFIGEGAKQATYFVSGLLLGKAKDAASGISTDDYMEV